MVRALKLRKKHEPESDEAAGYSAKRGAAAAGDLLKLAATDPVMAVASGVVVTGLVAGTAFRLWRSKGPGARRRPAEAAREQEKFRH